MITIRVQFTATVIWADLYVNNKRILTKGLKTDDQLQALRDQVELINNLNRGGK